jgi:predicted choloylglycine hydrolase
VTWNPTALVELDVTFRAVDAGSTVGETLPALFATAWSSYRAWFLREGEDARPSYSESAGQLRRHLPELAATYDSLVEAVGGGDLEARFLSHWCPPAVATACSLAVWNRWGNVLVRSYDFPPDQCDRTALGSQWNGQRVLAMSDCLWGAVDGINEHGLAVAIAFGGRPVVGPGFGIGLVVRYVLEFARTVAEAVEIFQRVPISMAYNVALADRVGHGVIVSVSPDRPAIVTPDLTAGNRQGWTEWPEHAAMCATIEREAVLAAAIADPMMTAGGLASTFLQAPLWRDSAITPWGTVYAAAYDCDHGTLDLMWPDDSWRLSVHGVVPGTRTRHSWVALPPVTAPAPLEPWPVTAYADASVL